MEVSKVLVNGRSYNIEDKNARELINFLQKKVETLEKKSIPLYTVIGKAIPLRPVVGYIYYTNKVKATGKDINYFGTIKASDFKNNLSNEKFINANDGKIEYDELVKGEVKDANVSYVINICDFYEKHFYRVKPYTGHITINDLEIIETSQLPLASKNFTLLYNDITSSYDIFPTIVAKNYIINHTATLLKLYNIITNLYERLNYRYKVYYTRKRVVRHNIVGGNSKRNRAGMKWCLARFKFKDYTNDIHTDKCGYSYIYRKIINVKDNNARCNRFPKVVIKKRIGRSNKYATVMTFVNE